MYGAMDWIDDISTREMVSIPRLAEDGLRKRLERLSQIIDDSYLAEEDILKIAEYIERIHDLVDGYERNHS